MAGAGVLVGAGVGTLGVGTQALAGVGTTGHGTDTINLSIVTTMHSMQDDVERM